MNSKRNESPEMLLTVLFQVCPFKSRGPKTISLILETETGHDPIFEQT